MENMEKYNSYMDKISADETLHNQLMEITVGHDDPGVPFCDPGVPNNVRRVRNPMYALAASLCTIIGLTAAVFLWGGGSGVLDPISPTPPSNPTEPSNPTTAATSYPTLPTSPTDGIPPANPAVTGLAVNNFCLSDLDTGASGVMSLRFAYWDLISFFGWGKSPQAFAYVRVLDTELTTHTEIICPLREKSFTYEAQTSVLEIIDTIWNRGDAVPETITLTQGVYRGNIAMFCDSVTNLLREGGVYMLPLHYDNKGLGWSFMGDLDVLFEVDNKGKVWSHSPSPYFSQFDGRDTGVLTQAIVDLTSDENFDTAVSRFGWYAKTAALAEITVTSAEQSVAQVYTLTDTGERVTEYRYDYTFEANVLSKGSNYAPESGVIPAVSLMVPLEQGQRYLILLEIYGEYETMPAIQPELIAKINADGTITPYNPLISTSPYEKYWSAFDDFDGYTVLQMAEFAERAKTWHENNPCSVFG
jgi:hypothetical protein